MSTDGRDLPAAMRPTWYAGDLPTFEEMRREAFRLLVDAQDTLRSDWSEGAGPSDEQAEALTDASRAIAAAKEALDQAAR